MDAGKLDRRITLMQRETTQDPTYGSIIEGDWNDIATVWAQVLDVLPSKGESITDDINIARRPCRVRIRFRSGVSSDMRMSIDGRTGTWRIVTQPAEIGRREYLEFMAEQMTTEGQEP